MDHHASEDQLTEEQAVQLARRYAGAYNDRDLDAMLDVLAEDIVSYPSRLFSTGPHRGHADVRAWWQQMVDTGRWYRVNLAEVRLLPPDRAAMLGQIEDGDEILSPWAIVIRVRDGRIIESHSYLSDRELLEELGVIE